MKKYIFIIAALFIGSVNMFAQTDWSIDKAHTHILFGVKHMMVSTVTGYFKIFDGTVSSASDDLNNAKIDLSVDISSISTENEMRDNHLKSPDFFDAQKFPKMTFKSKFFKKLKGNKYLLTGDLTIKNVTKEVKLDVTYNGTIKDPYGMTRAGFELKGKLNRFDYGLSWNKTIEAGGLIVDKTINISAAIEITKNEKK